MKKSTKKQVSFGIRFLGSLGNAEQLQRWGLLAEKSGFDSCWFAHDPFQRNSWVSAAAVATVTKKISIGYNIKPYTIDPSEIATFAAGLDELSHGRVKLALGSHTEVMYDWLGLNKGDLVNLTKESVSLVRGLLQGKTMKFAGKVFHWSEECYLRFSPLRRKIPIYIPGIGRKMFGLSGEIGDGSLPMATPPESFDYPYRFITEGARKVGRNPDELDYVGLIWIYVSKSGAVDKLALKKVVSYFLPYLEEKMIGRLGIAKEDIAPITRELRRGNYESAAAKVSDEMLQLAVFGTPQECIARIENMVKKGATSVSIGGPLGADPEEAIRLIGSTVIPHFKN